jgi:hypothetical protein
MSDKPYRPRLVVEIDEEQHRKLQQIFPHGFLRPFFKVIIDEVIDLIEVGGKQAMGLIIAGAIMPSDVVPSIKKIKEEIDGNTG